MFIEKSDKSNDIKEYWVFGYGSLIWKPPPVYEERISGFIKGYVRRFWQGSVDHRGTEENPGRVVTLIPIEEWKLHDHEDGITWGVAYRIHEKDVEDIKKYLDYREKNGYTIHYLDVFQSGHDEPVVKNAIVYIATTENESYIGPAPLDVIAQQIFRSVGPSGPNKEYLLNLTSALRFVAPDAYDGHLFDLEKRVLELES
ncbi:15352_t:CDS:2 [Acaulospora morrowiae]|uniref:glutathione-specific gamma-glutamylcyclotransferase n=1 Tax=Acaulospora morrowiae TaxID=94023 RepID=A0A9N9B675_9GLOM|nr:15352_t:CDS:2 [Acaulospora morrowiae]